MVIFQIRSKDRRNGQRESTREKQTVRRELGVYMWKEEFLIFLPAHKVQSGSKTVMTDTLISTNVVKFKISLFNVSFKKERTFLSGKKAYFENEAQP